MLDNVSEIEASIRKSCNRATHFIGSDKNLSMEEIGYGIPATSTEILSYFKNENIKIA